VFVTRCLILALGRGARRCCCCCSKMKPTIRRALSSTSVFGLSAYPIRTPAPGCRIARAIHSGSAQAAKVAPVYGTGPPPDAPLPSAEYTSDRLARRRRQAELLKQAKDIRAAVAAGTGAKSKTGGSGPLRRRFWKEVHVKEVDGRWYFFLSCLVHLPK
jgi:hypothetical protein